MAAEWGEEGEELWEAGEEEDDDSLCSWLSDTDSVPHNWRGWRSPANPAPPRPQLDSLSTAAAKTLARHFTLDGVEECLSASGLAFTALHPDAFQMKMIRYCFPRSDHDIRLYSVLASGNSEEFLRGESLFRAKAVRHLLQIGFHLSATVRCSTRGGPGGDEYSVAITVDRCHITSCTCTCTSEASWCAHTVAVCLHRIQWPRDCEFRAPLSESLNQLARVGGSGDEVEDLRAAVRRLQKFAQHLIQQLPRQILPTAQSLLDELKEPESVKNKENGAPDPTSGGGRDEVAAWRMDSQRLTEKVSRMFSKLCTPAPTVFSDVNYLSSSLPPAAAEWQSLLKPLRGKDPEGLWNLLGIVSELLRRRDDNGPDLLHLITKQLVGKPQVVMWWVGTKLAQSGRWLPVTGKAGLASSAQFSAASVADQLVALWRLVALNPKLSPSVRLSLRRILLNFHLQVVRTVSAALIDENRDKTLSLGRLSAESVRWDLDSFPGFKAAIVATHSDWTSFPIHGLTYEDCTTPSAVSQELTLATADLEVLDMRSSASPALPVIRPTTTKHIVSTPPPRLSSVPTNTRDESLEDIQAIYMLPPEEDVEEQQAEEVEKEEDPVGLVEAELKALGPIMDARELRFSRCQALHAHGHMEHAWRLAMEMADDLLRDPPDLMRELPPPIKVPVSCKAGLGKKKRKGGDDRMPHPMAVGISAEASATLDRASFLFHVLLRGPNHHSLAFRVALLALETPRQAAATKFLEVKMNQQEAELVSALRGLELGTAEVEMVRERARRLRSPKPPTPPVLPFALAHFAFHVLTQPDRTPADEQLGFDAAIATLALRSSISEAEHPLLCEASRRQRGDLAITLLLRYKDQPERLNFIMSTLLDPEMHQMFPSRKAGDGRKLSSGGAPSRTFSGASESAGLDDELMAQIEAETALEGAEVADIVGGEEPGELEEADAASDSSSSGGLRAAVSARKLSSQSPPRHSLAGPSQLRLRGKRPDAAPSLPGQASKAQAHFMTELAKRVLSEAGGSQSSAIFNAAQNLPPQGVAQPLPGGPHPALHLCAFKIGLYALGLDNKVSQNWLTRTYSTQVSWISCQAQEIGRTAISILIQCWENHLTPTEVATLADKASLGRGEGMLEATAELALSVLPHAHALSVADTKRALIQAKDQGTRMLEQACIAVEQAAKDFGVYPEVLFEVARHWSSMYMEEAQGEPGAAQPPQLQQQQQQQQQLAVALQQQQMQLQAAQQAAFASTFQAQPQFHHLSHQFQQQLFPYQAYMGKLNFAATGNGNGAGFYPSLLAQAQPPIRPNPAVLPYTLNHQQQQHFLQGYNIHVGGPRALHMSQSAPSLQLNQQQQPHTSRHSSSHSGHHHHHSLNPYHAPNHLIPTIQELEGEASGNGTTGSGLKYLHNAYRVGMLGMETMGRRIQDERSYTKYGPNPTYGDDVKFLLGISKKLSLAHAQRFFMASGQSIVSPYILWEMGLEAAGLLAGPLPAPNTHPSLLRHNLAHPTVHYLVDRSIHMFYEAAHQKLSHPRFMPSDVEEVLHLIKEANRNFHQVPGGREKFQDFLESVRKQKACKKDLWGKITAALSNPHN